jgi:hypothetical protein
MSAGGTSSYGTDFIDGGAGVRTPWTSASALAQSGIS